jgi:hypothetical protein
MHLGAARSDIQTAEISLELSVRIKSVAIFERLTENRYLAKL